MECSVSASDGRKWDLPKAYEWDIAHGFGSPCDSFEVRIPLTEHSGEILANAVYFSADSGGRAVFRGIIDEFELREGTEGASVFLRGRGMQARLLDNEAESAQHSRLSFNTLMSLYARPFGISKANEGKAAGASGEMTVDSGASCWSVINTFCRFYAGTVPRFSPDGTLYADGEAGGAQLVVDDSVPVSEISYCEDRYGVISKVVVKNKSTGAVVTVNNGKHPEKELSCRRIVTVPRLTGAAAMRRTGEYQIAESEREMMTMRLTLPWEFAAFPGDRVEVRRSALGIAGAFTVCESRCTGSGAGIKTELMLRKANI